MATAVDKAAEIKKPIGKAGLAEVSISEELKQLGWRIEKLESGFSAYEINGERKIGPATSIKALQTQVNLASGPVKAKTPNKAVDMAEQMEEAAAELADSGVYEPRLPSMDEPELDDLNRQADNCIAALEKRKLATTESKDQDDIMRQKMRDHGRKHYHRRGWSLVIEDSEKLVVKKSESVPAKNPSTKRIPKIIKVDRDQ